MKCDCRKLPERFPDGVSLCLYRVVQESLRNVREHAQVRNVRVTLRCGNGEIVLTIADDGRGFVRDTVRGKGGLGLISMEERVRLVGGSSPSYPDLAAEPGSKSAFRLHNPSRGSVKPGGF